MDEPMPQPAGRWCVRPATDPTNCDCKVFKAQSTIERLQLVKMASLCTNCLGNGHSITQCTPRSCHICGRRHHTYLHREQIQENSRSSSGRSSSGRSSSGRSSGSRSSSGRSSGRRSSHKRSSHGQSPSGSSKSRSVHHSRRPSKHSNNHTPSAPSDTKVHTSYESRASRTKGNVPDSSSKTQPEQN